MLVQAVQNYLVEVVTRKGISILCMEGRNLILVHAARKLSVLMTA